MPLKRWLWIGFFGGLMQGCIGHYGDQFLDASIPRVVTPSEQIAFVRTKWVNNKLRQTTFLDRQNRILEDFVYGYSSEKTLNVYKGDKKASSTWYYHSDSSPSGYVDVIESWSDYDRTGRVVRVHNNNAGIKPLGMERRKDASVVYYTYKTPYDTLIKRLPVPDPDLSTVTNTNRWERNKQGQIERHLRLYVMKGPHESTLDTIYYYSHRFSYDKFGRRNLAWYDTMYLGRYYHLAEPDTIHYSYDRHSQVVREERIYTLDTRNKLEIDTTSLDKFGREDAARYRRQFFVGDGEYPPTNKKTDIVVYRYERFDRAKHLPLQVSQDIGY